MLYVLVYDNGEGLFAGGAVAEAVSMYHLLAWLTLDGVIIFSACKVACTADKEEQHAWVCAGSSPGIYGCFAQYVPSIEECVELLKAKAIWETLSLNVSIEILCICEGFAGKGNGPVCTMTGLDLLQYTRVVLRSVLHLSRGSSLIWQAVHARIWFCLLTLGWRARGNWCPNNRSNGP